MAARAKVPLHVFDRTFYAKVGAASFALGAGIELFMLKTGFYNTVTALEAERVLLVATGEGPEPGKRAGVDPWAQRSTPR